MRSRKKAEAMAEQVLQRGGLVSDEDILMVLRVWRFRRNKSRLNVMRENETWVYSDTLGIVRSRDGRLCYI